MTIAGCVKEATRRSGVPARMVEQYFTEPPSGANHEVPEDLARPFIKYVTKWNKRLWKTGKADKAALAVVLYKLLAELASRRN